MRARCFLFGFQGFCGFFGFRGGGAQSSGAPCFQIWGGSGSVLKGLLWEPQTGNPSSIVGI